MSLLPESVLSTFERKGKFLQLILHGLTVAKDGNTGALAILASCVMITHFVLLCARLDFEALHELMLDNEAIADQDNAAALAWLMQACNPALFAVAARATASAHSATTTGGACSYASKRGEGGRVTDGKRHRWRGGKTRREVLEGSDESGEEGGGWMGGGDESRMVSNTFEICLAVSYKYMYIYMCMSFSYRNVHMFIYSYICLFISNMLVLVFRVWGGYG